jgi:hypothetical protein
MGGYVGNEFFALCFKNPSAADALRARYSELLEQHSPYRVVQHWLSPRRELAVLNVARKAALQDDGSSVPHNTLRSSAQRALLQTGYTTTPIERVDASLRRAGSGLTAKDAGGIAAFCLALCEPGAEETLFLWSTRPSGMRCIAIAESADFVVAGTRPYWVHRIAQAFERPNLDPAYVLGALAGWSLDERTPYVGTTVLPVDAMLSIRSGARALHGHPTPGYERAPRRRLWHPERPRFREALRDAVEPLRGLPGFELRMSGGEDSRLIAATLRAVGITPSSAVCHGTEGEWEAPVAARVADALGWSLKCLVPQFAQLGGIHATVRRNLTLADGFLATEPLQAAYPQYGMSGERGPGLVFGHMELHRGGWAKGMKVTRKKSLHLARFWMTPFRDCVVPSLVVEPHRLLSEYVAGLGRVSTPELMYWINYRFRVCRWLAPHYLLHSHELLPIYPLVDEKVVRVLNDAPIEQLVSERLVFDTTTRFAPQLRPVPLFRSRYRFEAERRSWRSPFGYRAREPVQPGVSSYLKPEVRMPGDIRPQLCQAIREGKLRHELREASRPALWAVIDDPSPANVQAAGVDGQRLASYLWTCYQASVLFTDGLEH